MCCMQFCRQTCPYKFKYIPAIYNMIRSSALYSHSFLLRRIADSLKWYFIFFIMWLLDFFSFCFTTTLVFLCTFMNYFLCNWDPTWFIFPCARYLYGNWREFLFNEIFEKDKKNSWSHGINGFLLVFLFGF